jgi:small nuclear ribonucleoprotein (snRNP)-like protein
VVFGTIANVSPAYSFFKTLVEHEITVELKNEVCIRGTLKSVDQYLNIKLDNAEATDEARWPHLVCWSVNLRHRQGD